MMGQELPVARDWYCSRELEDGVILYWEGHVYEFARCNIWLVIGGERDLLIDSGTGLRPLRPALQRSAGRELIACATHGHFDHVGALHEFADRRAHVAEAGGYHDMPDSHTLAHLFRELDAPVDALPCPLWDPAGYQVASAPMGESLTDGSRIDLGGRTLTVLHLPGHSPGSIGFFDERDGTVFSGDALYDGPLIDDFPSSDVERYCATMQRLALLPISAGHGGHGPSFDDDRKSVPVQEYLAGKRTQACPRHSL